MTGKTPCSDIRRGVLWYKFTGVSLEYTAFLFMVKESAEWVVLSDFLLHIPVHRTHISRLYINTSSKNLDKVGVVSAKLSVGSHSKGRKLRVLRRQQFLQTVRSNSQATESAVICKTQSGQLVSMLPTQSLATGNRLAAGRTKTGWITGVRFPIAVYIIVCGS